MPKRTGDRYRGDEVMLSDTVKSRKKQKSKSQSWFTVAAPSVSNLAVSSAEVDGGTSAHVPPVQHLKSFHSSAQRTDIPAVHVSEHVNS